jgi:hypothetical protein
MSIEDKFAIQELIACFANSFDVKDWNGLESCFTDASTRITQTYEAPRQKRSVPVNMFPRVVNLWII